MKFQTRAHSDASYKCTIGCLAPQEDDIETGVFKFFGLVKTSGISFFIAGNNLPHALVVK